MRIVRSFGSFKQADSFTTAIAKGLAITPGSPLRGIAPEDAARELVAQLVAGPTQAEATARWRQGIQIDDEPPWGRR